jgi:hypothetical protein
MIDQMIWIVGAVHAVYVSKVIKQIHENDLEIGSLIHNSIMTDQVCFKFL